MDGLNDFHWENIDPDGEMEDDDLPEPVVNVEPLFVPFLVHILSFYNLI